MTDRVRGLLGLLGLLGVAALLVAGVVAAATSSRGSASIVVGSKNFSESWILAEIYAQRIERQTGLTVRRRHALGGTLLAFEGLKSGALDLYPEYTGTGLVSILGEPVSSDASTVLPTVREAFARRWSMTWLSPQAFNNSYALAMPRDRAEALRLTKVSQLVEHPDLVPGFATEFVARDDGWPGLTAHYGLSPNAEPKAMEAGLMYQAAAAGEVDLISAYATDARIDKFDLFVLQDDKGFFPPYQATPLLAPGLPERHPEIVEALAPLGGLLDDAEMRRLNARVDIDKRDPADVAREFLDAAGL
ncbi:MAG: glycine betaine ABC transporter substrate-binding protein [Myxococcota bacterium]